MDLFPLPPSSTYTYQQRFGPAEDHWGTDIMAPLGTQVLAVEDGTAWAAIDPKGGNVAYLDGTSGNRYYYAHLAWWAPLLQIDANPKVTVKAGDVIGHVGDTGNAHGGPPHLHFQIRRGSLRIDPYPELQKVDPNPQRGSRASSVAPSGVLLLLALAWLAWGNE